MNTIRTTSARKTLTRIAAAAVLTAGLGVALGGTASAQIALGGPFTPPYSASAQGGTDSVRIWSQIQGGDTDSQIQGVFLGMQVR
ncbi:hypothetical protein [Saccharothrix sp.]|uniref:hypothetical protein n=1 Tax=Saccharothrix sp. TaxID=1873460 RepID=UPI0028127F6A|nr:hypothetical protein [Saccharothrix sp.]